MGNRGKVVGSSLEKSWEIIEKVWEGRGKGSGKFNIHGKAFIIAMDMYGKSRGKL